MSSAMFDVEPADIQKLNDTDLRELVGRLCEAELAAQGLSPAAVTWGGSQTAKDGGLDVRVNLPSGIDIAGFIPRGATGFQVKKPDMARSAITNEMRPGGRIRPVIDELANMSGAYVIVSASGSTAETGLRSRRTAMRDALGDVTHADQLQTDFYDRTRLAAWIRMHPGVATWMRERIGKPLVGWRPYGAWSSPTEDIQAEYLLDETLRLHLGQSTLAVHEGIDALRDELAQPGKVVRLVGLSGVGKTRFAQALFDGRIGSRALPPSLAIYTSLPDAINPAPVGLASQLVATRTRAIMVVDNCPPDLHRELAELCRVPASRLSVITVEYDVREDQPEGTQVVVLETSSTGLIEKLLLQRYRTLSQVNARTIAEASDGNARIAIAYAETIGVTESISGLSNEELFLRLFRQRHEADEGLLAAAKACSLVYSFWGEGISQGESELPHLAKLADQTPRTVFKHMSELRRRDLVQARGPWRAVLPHAIANRLARHALDDLPFEVIDQHLLAGGTARLARSFSRRLSFLHDHPVAVSIAQNWVAPGGLLSDLRTFDDDRQAMFRNIAPVVPDAVLSILEQESGGAATWSTSVRRLAISLSRSLAYDARFFERSVAVLVRLGTAQEKKGDLSSASETFLSLFPICLSGTHATIEQRLKVIESLLRSERELGVEALKRVLQTGFFSSHHSFEFGSQLRDFGYEVRTGDDVRHWYASALQLIERVARADPTLESSLKSLLVENFRGLWSASGAHDELAKLLRLFSVNGFWREGWGACRESLFYDGESMAPDIKAQLSGLESELRPASLADRVRASALGRTWGNSAELDGLDPLQDMGVVLQRLDQIAYDLGQAVAVAPVVLDELLPDLMEGGVRAWQFGRGLASRATEPFAVWTKLATSIDARTIDISVHRGFVHWLWEHKRDVAQRVLDNALEHAAFAGLFPMLQSAVDLDKRAVGRLRRALHEGRSPVYMYRALCSAPDADPLDGNDFRDLVGQVAAQENGLDVALEILDMRIHSDNLASHDLEPLVLQTGRDLLDRVQFARHFAGQDHRLAEIVKTCCVSSEGEAAAIRVAIRLGTAVAEYRAHWTSYDELTCALLELHPVSVLNALFPVEAEDLDRRAFSFREARSHFRRSTGLIPDDALLTWCAQHPASRYALAAALVPFAVRAADGEGVMWSHQALLLFEHAPDCRLVLAAFIDRFSPTSWSGSRAVLIEANARLLDTLDGRVPPGVMSFVEQNRRRLSHLIEEERKQELDRARISDERFE
ncbi:hypothetical protein [Paraburkholderia lycopersici]|uniref:Uncharacterized protein n=1 Tax=Paraburkholderia lycopersici TaxID=416944 RepID=A0A1G6UHF2_9BURK|nr:hypothetical protein [Paraburkholderia lycopersici]SDD40684.1 hypothetical protein SAMN05421548_1199 [Paraburkholderia lycopersici]